MRKFFAVCVVAFVSLMLANTADAERFGVKVGTNVTSLDFKAGMPPTLGYSAGITWQWDLPLGFALQPDLVYHVKASRLSDVTYETFGLGYVELPINVQWGLRFAERNLRVFAQASPFVGYAVAQTGGMENIADKINNWTNINRFSYGAGLGLGVQLWALQVTAQYTWHLGQLADVKDVALSDFNDRNFGGYVISVALLFGKKNKNN